MSTGQDSTHSAYSAPIVSKAMKVLKMIVTSGRNPGISEIAAKLSLAKSTTHGILAALEETGWVLRDPVTRKYTCGYTAKDIAGKADVRLPLVEKARPHLKRLAVELDEDIHLAISTGTHLLIIDQMESAKELKITARPGTRLPIFAGAAGKIFLAHQDRDAVNRILRSKPIPQFTQNSITDPNLYLEELDRVRERGSAQDIAEYLTNVWCVALPIFYGKKNRRRMVAGFWVVGINSAVTQQRMQAAERLGRITSDAISRTITHYNQDDGS
jgi:DNA-binding IclR family transcriptional regulator